MGGYYQKFWKYPIEIFIFWTYNLFSKNIFMVIVKMFYLFEVA